MKKLFSTLFMILMIISCRDNQEISSIDPVNWNIRKANSVVSDSMSQGTTYLSVYSQIYSQTEHRKHSLTVTVSMRNTNRQDTVYIDKAEYFDTKGHLIRKYFDHSIYIAPMETVEIVIDENDQAGGTGANFIFDWKIKPGIHIPLFEGIMISTSGQQGLSFTTTGVRVD